MICDELGLLNVSSGNDALQPLDGHEFESRLASWLKQRGWHNPESETTYSLTSQALERPWSNETPPPFEDWIDQNSDAIDMVVLATSRPRYYAPSPSLLRQAPLDLCDVWLPWVSGARDSGDALVARAMSRLGKGDTSGAWNDLIACHRLARLVGQGTTLVEKSAAAGISSGACLATVALMSDHSLRHADAIKIQRDLEALPPLKILTPELVQVARIAMLSSIVEQSRRPRKLLRNGVVDELYLDYVNNNTRLNAVAGLRIDWNVALSSANLWFDRLQKSCDRSITDLPPSRNRESRNRLIRDASSKRST